MPPEQSQRIRHRKRRLTDSSQPQSRKGYSTTLAILVLCCLLPVVQGGIDYSSYYNNYPSSSDSSDSALDQDFYNNRHLAEDNRNNNNNRNDHNNNNHHGHYRHYHSQSSQNYAKSSSISDIVLCLACALGWTVWFVSQTQKPSPFHQESMVFDQQPSQTVMGHVLQVTIGEDSDGTGIPVYHAVVDYVVESPLLDEEPLQVRKQFTTNKLLEEGFANIQVLFLVEDPTTSVLLEDYIEDKHLRFQQQPPGILWTVSVYLVVAILIGSSFIGAVHAIQHLDEAQQQVGWIILAVGIILLYPMALFLYLLCSRGHQAILPLLERPAVIIHGAAQRFDCTQQGCGAMMNPMEILDDMSPNTPGVGASGTGLHNSAWLASRSSSHPKNHQGTNNIDTLHKTNTGDTTKYNQGSMSTAPKSPLYPNAGCGFGNFNIHMPTNPSNGESSISSMSSSGTPLGSSQSNNNNNNKTKKKNFGGRSGRDFGGMDTSILEKYEKVLDESLMLPR